MVFGLFSFANAATYEYIDSSGNTKTTTANTGSEALLNAPNLAVNSGVILVDQNNNTTYTYQSSNATQYGYVNSSGVITSITANTATQALANAINISAHSGVILLNSTVDQNLIGDTLPVR